MLFAVYTASGQGDGWILRAVERTPEQAESDRVEQSDGFPNEVTAVASINGQPPYFVRGSLFGNAAFADVSVFAPVHSGGAMRLAR